MRGEASAFSACSDLLRGSQTTGGRQASHFSGRWAGIVLGQHLGFTCVILFCLLITHDIGASQPPCLLVQPVEMCGFIDEETEA